MADTDLIDIGTLCQLIDYDAATGELSWLARPREMFSSDRSWKAWNSRCAGKVAKCAKNTSGYYQISILSKLYVAHRIAWALFNRAWPADRIDHINGIRTDNRICNLRDVSSLQNSQNAARRKDNSSGCTGVSFRRDLGVYRARITVCGERIALGSFANVMDAVTARKAAELLYGFHENHGRG